MADSPKWKLRRNLSSSLFASQRMFLFDSTDSTAMSPTSILDSRPLSLFKNPFWPESIKHDHDTKPLSRCWESKGVGLAVIDSEPDCSRTVVLFGSSQLKSPGEYGTKSNTRNTSSPGKKSMSGSATCLTAGEMERSEDYTRVICRGANPRTTHIFDDCVVGLSEKESVFFIGEQNEKVSFRRDENFLSLCSSCRKKLEIGTDIYMFKGEKAFCSEECRSEEMSKSGRDEF